MQYFLPNRKTLSAYYQNNNVDVPENGIPFHLPYQWPSLAAMDVQELTRTVSEDSVLWGLTGSFSGGSGTAGVWIQIYLIHQGKVLPLFSKPRPLESVCGSGSLPMVVKPALAIPAGDSLMVEVRSQDRSNAQKVEVVLYCNKLPAQLNPYQKIVWNAKLAAYDRFKQPNRDVAGDQAPTSAAPLVQGPQLFNYPAPGASAVTIFSYTVPPGQRARIFEHALQHVGGNPPESSGSGVIWRFLVNGWPLKGLGAQTAQIGSFATPDKVVIWLTENDTFSVTVEIPAAGNVQAGSSGYRINGWTAPLRGATGGTQ